MGLTLPSGLSFERPLQAEPPWSLKILPSSISSWSSSVLPNGRSPARLIVSSGSASPSCGQTGVQPLRFSNPTR